MIASCWAKAFLVVFFAVGSVWAQGAAEYAGAVSAAASVASSKETKKVAFPERTGKEKFRHLPSGIGASDEEDNRRKLEENAGKEAASLLLRSEPDGARVWLNGLRVGRTPLLLVVAPGDYALELRGERSGLTEKRVAVLAGEKKEMVIPLRVRYPAAVRLE